MTNAILVKPKYLLLWEKQGTLFNIERSILEYLILAVNRLWISINIIMSIDASDFDVIFRAGVHVGGRGVGGTAIILHKWVFDFHRLLANWEILAIFIFSSPDKWSTISL